MTAISVIVPAYNEEKNLPQCFDCFHRIKNPEIEFIIIDDGSTDRTEAVCREAIQCDYRIKYYRQENGGVARARNRGIDVARGRWVVFVDADDILDSSKFEAVTESIGQIKEPIVQCLLEEENGKHVFLEILDSDEVQKATLNRNYYSTTNPDRRAIYNSTHGPYGKLFLKDFLNENNIRFIEGLGLGEDLMFYLEALEHCNHVAVIHEKIYRIEVNASSSTRKYNPKMIGYALDFCNNLDDFELRNKKDEEFEIQAAYQRFVHIEVGIISCFIDEENHDSLFKRVQDWRNLCRDNKCINAIVHKVYKNRGQVCTDRNEKIGVAMLQWHMTGVYFVLKRRARKRYLRSLQ